MDSLQTSLDTSLVLRYIGIVKDFITQHKMFCGQYENVGIEKVLINKRTQPTGSLDCGVYLYKTVGLLIKGEVETKLNISQIKAFRREIFEDILESCNLEFEEDESEKITHRGILHTLSNYIKIHWNNIFNFKRTFVILRTSK